MRQQLGQPQHDTGTGGNGITIGAPRVPATADVLRDLEQGEQALTLRELAADPSVPHGRAGRPASVATLYRQVLRGRNGYRLGTIKTARGMVTTRAEWLRYLGRINGVGASGPAQRSPSRRERDVDRAEQQLARMGMT